MLGIRQLENGFEKIRIQPFVPENVRCAKGGFVCGLGRIWVEWHLVGEKEIMINAEIPEDVHAEITAPDGYVLSPGIAVHHGV